MSAQASNGIARRDFFQILGSGLLVLLLESHGLAQESGNNGRRRGGFRGGARPADINAWLHLGEDGIATVCTGKAEVGQNIRTSLSQAVAEELRIPVASIRMIMADTDLTPFDAGTFGSRTTPDMAAYLHRVGAAAREALLDLAAEALKTDRNNLTIADGKVSRNDGSTSATFAELTKGQKLTKTIGDQEPVTPTAQWKIVGTAVPKVDGREFVTGKHKYSTDIKLPGMLYGKVLRPPSYEATLASLDTTKAEAMEGVTVVRDGGFVGVVAPDSFRAAKALEAMQAQWTTKPQPSKAETFEAWQKSVPGGNNAATADPGNGEQRLRQTYTIAYIAHAPLEPRAAVADWQDGKLTVWTGTQRPFGVRGDLAQAFGVSDDRVRVIVPDTGSGYGGKHSGEAAVEAARLAKAAGKPVKLIWTREEEFTWAYFRPGGFIDVSSTVQPDGKITAWEFHNINSGGAGVRSPYDIPGQKSEFHGGRSPLKQGSYRGLAATANHFAREMHMDELARAVKMDPLAFRNANLRDDRLKAVLNAATKRFGWENRQTAKGTGFGLACGTEKGSYLATCAEVSHNPETGDLKIVRVVTAFECGAIVNPLHLENQVLGATVMGLGGALFEAIDFDQGQIKNAHFADYRVPRFRDTPEIEVVLLDRKDLPSSGAGETPIIGIAPALGSAIFDAAGVRLNALPMAPRGVRA